MKFWQELRRRRVFRTAGLYIVGAWLIIQVADIFFPAWSIPETAIRFLIGAAAACFPIALLFGWRYDITSKGIVRTEPAHRDELFDLSLKPVDYFVLTAFVAVGLAIFLGSAGKIQEEIRSSPSGAPSLERLDNSIAVMPFKNFDINPETGYFSDGVTEEILHRLSTLGVLHVLASSSSFVFKDSRESPVSISERLGVRYLLQGSVRREANQVRITARLLDQTGFQVWSGTYDRELKSIFAIQSEIARKVTGEIVSEIVPIHELPAGRTTSDMEAYDAYLAGMSYQDARTPGWREKALNAYSKAIALDPGFAPPYAGTAIVKTVNLGYGQHLEDARALAEQALELDPQLAPAYAILGLIQSNTGDPQRGLENLEKALELDPSFAIAYSWISHPLELLGRFAELKEKLRQGLEVDPLNPVLVRNVALDLESRAGNFERAERLLMRLTNIPDPPVQAFHWLNTLYEDWGRYPQAIEAAKQHIRLQGGNTNPDALVRLANAYRRLGMDAVAQNWFNQFLRTSNERYLIGDFYRFGKLGSDPSPLTAYLDSMEADGIFDTGDDPGYYYSYAGLAYIQAGRLKKGVEYLEHGLVTYQQSYDPEYSSDAIDLAFLDNYWPSDVITDFVPRLAFAYQHTGRADDAEVLLKETGKLYWPEEEPDPRMPQQLEHFALYKAVLGDVAAAHGALETAVELGWANYQEIVNDIAWRDTIAAPEFQVLLEDVKAEVSRQREIVKSADAEDDFSTFVERFINESASGAD